jgi:cell division inhibitor SulA/protein ImuA
MQLSTSITLPVTTGSSPHLAQRLATHTAHPKVFRLGQFGSATLTDSEFVQSRFAELDAELPGGGWARPGLTEILTNHIGVGEISLLLKGACTSRGNANKSAVRTLWVLPPNQPWIPYAPGLVQRGINLDHLAIVHPKKNDEALWAAEQALKSGACQAVIVWLNSVYCNPLSLRRLLQSANAGKAMGFLIRPLEAAATPSPASLRIALHPAGEGKLRLDLLKRRGLPQEKSITLTTQTLPCLTRKGMPAKSKFEIGKSSNWLKQLLAGSNATSRLVRERSLIQDR